MISTSNFAQIWMLKGPCMWSCIVFSNNGQQRNRYQLAEYASHFDYKLANQTYDVGTLRLLVRTRTAKWRYSEDTNSNMADQFDVVKNQNPWSWFDLRRKKKTLVLTVILDFDLFLTFILPFILCISHLRFLQQNIPAVKTLLWIKE